MNEARLASVQFHEAAQLQKVAAAVTLARASYQSYRGAADLVAGPGVAEVAPSGADNAA